MSATALDDATVDDSATSQGPQSGYWPEPGHVFAGRYRLIGRIGRGGQGEVWEAEDRIVGDLAAVKILPHGFGADAARARREIATLRLLRLPGVVHLRDEGVDGERAFLVMDRIVGAPFPGRPLPCTWSEIEATTVRLLDALERIHAVGVVHGDLKPSNVLVDADERPTVLDFGISQFGLESRIAFTRGVEPLGTPRYLAPEQLMGEPVTARTDLYAVGLILFEALTGQLPHGEGNLRSILIARLTQPARSLQALVPDLPPKVAQAIQRMLAISREDRPRSAAEALAMLRGGRPPGTGVWTRLGLPLGDQPLAEEQLQPLFAGPDRLLHLREDGARALYRATDGVPARVAAEVEAWVETGLARWHEGQIVIDRDALERLDMGLVRGLALPQPHGPTAVSLPDPLAEVLTWVTLAGPAADIEVLRDVAGGTERWLQTQIGELVARGLVRRTQTGRFEPMVAAPGDAMSRERRRAAHAALAKALPPGAPRRLLHLIAGSDESSAESAKEIAAEAVVVAEGYARDGQLAKAIVALEEGLRALRNAPCPPEDTYPLLSLWVQVALSDGTPRVLDRVLYEILRFEPTTPELTRLGDLVRAGLALGTWDDRAITIVETIAPFDDRDLERHRQRLRLMAARRCSAELEESMLADVARWAASSADPRATAMVALWRGRFAYRSGNYSEAADAYLAAASGEVSLHEKLTATVAAAAALIEEGRFEEARAAAEQALADARRCRDPVSEGKAEWVLRTIAYRSEEPLTADADLVSAASHLGAPDVEAAIALTEAVIAFREGRYDLAREYVLQAYDLWASAAQPNSLITGALAIACGATFAETEIAAIVERACCCSVPGIGIQALALLKSAGVRVSVDGAILERLASSIPRKRWGARLDVLSVNEALAQLRDAEQGA